MTYEQTIELEENVKIKNKADEIYKLFLKNIKLDVAKYKGDGRFVYWSDQHNATYFICKDGFIRFNCEFLHNSYDVLCTPSGIFNAIKYKNKGLDHLLSAVKDK